MKFTLSWLKDYLDFGDSNLKNISQKLTDIGLEVESIDDKSAGLEIFTVAKIIEAKPHPQADNLQICSVDVGEKDLKQIVCGAKNARSGIKVIYAPIGSIIPSNNLKIKKSKIRNIESFGMLCSAAELEVGVDGEGIIEVDDKFNVNDKLTSIYNLSQPVIDINITPNRGDCLGVYGIARDLAGSGFGKLKEPNIKEIKPKSTSKINVKINNEASKLCPYFSGYYIKDITNKQSPDWLKEKLEAVDINPINAIVDITNYTMYCLNQPMHAYDADKIKGDIDVRIADNNEKFTSLKEIDYNLHGNELLICDNNQILGLAGIIGGQNSMTLDNTKNIFLEAAFFDGINIAQTGRKQNIISDSRYRFERNIDIKSVKKALDFAANLILDICGGEISKVIEVGSDSHKESIIEVRISKINKVLNGNFNIDDVIKILSDLKFTIKESSQDKIIVEVPSFRSDIAIEEDLIEEFIRIYGYNNIESQAIDFEQYNKIDLVGRPALNKMRHNMCNMGLSEIISWSFIDSNLAKYFTKINQNLLISNAISEEMDYMRPSLLIGLIQAVKKNQARGFTDLSLFEIGRIFEDADALSQPMAVSAIRVGKNRPRNHYKSERDFDVMDIKSDLVGALESLGINFKSVQISTSDLPEIWHPYKSAAIKQGKNIIGYFGEVHPIILKKIAIKSKINAFELMIDKLPKKINKIKKKPFIKSDFQVVNRDFAFIFDQDIKISDIIKSVKSADQELITNVGIFDVYQGEKIDLSKKSIAFNVEITPKSTTLSSDDIEKISSNIINVVEDRLSGVLRQ